ncbi:MAG: thioredoxin family protein [Patescibacteria group bacterium]
MNIQVLGSGCPTCHQLYKVTQEAAKELGWPIEVEYIKDIDKALAMGVMSLPVLAVNGRPILAGLLPSKEKIKKLLQENIT